MRNPKPAEPIWDRPGEMARLNQHISIGKGRMNLITGPSGHGKTSYLDSVFVLSKWYHYYKFGGQKPYFVYHSMERPVVEKLAKWLAWFIFLETGIVFTPDTILSRANKERDLHDGDWKLFEGYIHLFDAFSECIEIIPGSKTPEEILDKATYTATQLGVLFTTHNGSLFYEYRGEKKKIGDFTDAQTEQHGPVKLRYIDGRFGRIYEGHTVYLDKTPDTTVYHITDHLGKVDASGRGIFQASIDHANNAGNILRDVYKFCVFIVSQLNRDIFDTYRQKKTALTIRQSDIKNTGVVVENSDLVLGILNPLDFEAVYMAGYDATQLVGPKNQSLFRGLVVVKNSYGSEGLKLPYSFYGEMGFYRELPSDPLDCDFSNIINYKLN